MAVYVFFLCGVSCISLITETWRTTVLVCLAALFLSQLLTFKNKAARFFSILTAVLVVGLGLYTSENYRHYDDYLKESVPFLTIADMSDGAENPHISCSIQKNNSIYARDYTVADEMVTQLSAEQRRQQGVIGIYTEYCDSFLPGFSKKVIQEWKDIELGNLSTEPYDSKVLDLCE